MHKVINCMCYPVVPQPLAAIIVAAEQTVRRNLGREIAEVLGDARIHVASVDVNKSELAVSHPRRRVVRERLHKLHDSGSDLGRELRPH
jgi:hypothetical protein